MNKKLLYQKICFASIATVMVVALAADATPKKLDLGEINSIAQQTTVLIAPQLTKAELNDLLQKKPVKNWTMGSGVLVAKADRSYYVLTVAHNFSQEDVTANKPYGIVTSDRVVHVIAEINDYRDCNNFTPTTVAANAVPLIRFGCYQAKTKINGWDLAIVRFESDINYPVASIGDVKALKPGDTVYISGWPKIEAEPKLNPDGSPVLADGNIVCKDPAPQRQRRLAWGPIQAILPAAETLAENGYSIYYTDNTRPGMSGGPVFDSYGELVGIHGRGSNNKLVCGQAYQKTTAKGDLPQIKQDGKDENDPFNPDGNWNREDGGTGDGGTSGRGEQDKGRQGDGSSSSAQPNQLQQLYSSAQRVDSFRQLIGQVGVNLPLQLTPPSPEVIANGNTQIEVAVVGGSGRLEFDLAQGGFEDNKDVIQDIYSIFGFDLKTMLKDCTNVNLGEECEPNQR
ncbi:serine protease [[Phormidium] sp. ETS-05]|uniref:S1 family peptidase n=1 Tax=[Phormidium] sp. ETS-05 TaxID=222819 RepID=UPI0018EF1427|nr:serine protease [[Phormidium] sp. ETS-05]